VPGLHTFRITDAGLQAFPRTFGLTGREERVRGHRRLSCGIPELDELMGGGIPEGDSLLVAGSSGSGKSLLGTQFIVEGIRQDEPRDRATGNSYSTAPFFSPMSRVASNARQSGLCGVDFLLSLKAHCRDST